MSNKINNVVSCYNPGVYTYINRELNKKINVGKETTLPYKRIADNLHRYSHCRKGNPAPSPLPQLLETCLQKLGYERWRRYIRGRTWQPLPWAGGHGSHALWEIVFTVFTHWYMTKALELCGILYQNPSAQCNHEKKSEKHKLKDSLQNIWPILIKSFISWNTRKDWETDTDLLRGRRHDSKCHICWVGFWNQKRTQVEKRMKPDEVW